MKGILVAVVAIFGVIFMVALLPTFMTSVEATQTDEVTNSFNVTTAAGVTNSTVTLSQALWNDDTQNVETLSSDGGGGDNPVASTYTAASRGLLVTGLDAAKTRNVTVAYLTDGLEDYQGIGEGIPILPVIGLLAIIGLALAGLYRAWH